MTRETATRAQIALLIYLMTNGVLFGAGLILVLTWPALNADSGFWISAVVVMSFILAAPIATAEDASSHKIALGETRRRKKTAGLSADRCCFQSQTQPSTGFHRN